LFELKTVETVKNLSFNFINTSINRGVNEKNNIYFNRFNGLPEEAINLSNYNNRIKVQILLLNREIIKQ
jgi:hypothetical protein